MGLRYYLVETDEPPPLTLGPDKYFMLRRTLGLSLSRDIGINAPYVHPRVECRLALEQERDYIPLNCLQITCITTH